MLVFDLHSDTINYNVDFSRPAKGGHIGMDRIRKGGMGLLTLALATEVSIRRNKRGYQA